MAIFKVPRITTIQRLDIIFQESEIIYDTDLKKPFYGDGTTIGGVEFTYGVKQIKFSKKDAFLLSEQNLLNKQIDLDHVPILGSVSFDIISGIRQLENIDFYLDQNLVKWDNYGLDGFVDEMDLIQISYAYV